MRSLHANLPELELASSTDGLARCTTARQGVGLSGCAALLPAGTGSASLRASLRAATGRDVVGSHGNSVAVLDRLQLLQHLRHTGNRSQARRWPCFIMTLRDPASRLASAFRYDATRGISISGRVRPGRSPPLAAPRNDGLVAHLGSADPNAFVDALRDPAHPRHATALLLLKASYASPRWVQPLATPPTLRGGSPFLVSQLEPLRGLDCSIQEVHFVCTEKFDRDWTELINSLGGHHAFLFAGNASHHEHWRSRGTGQAAPLSLTPANRAFWEAEVFPRDAALHRRVCGGVP